ncbi:MAG: CPBP family intramembrane glutamic endopeptidase [Vicinamibacterales bacterium]
MFPDPADVPAPPAVPASRRDARLRALFEVVLCSSYPTQLAIAGLLRLAGLAPTGPDGQLSGTFVFTLSLLDAVVLLSLIVFFLRRGGESPARLFLGARSSLREAALGLALLPAVFMAVVTVLLLVQALAPGLRNVPVNPLGALADTPWGLAGFVVVVLVAGGLREELQRAFLLHRFERHLGGAAVGVVVTSLAFGLGHTVQGWDAAIATGVLGFAWALLFLWRRSVVAGVVSHALFNCAELLRAALLP